MDRQTTLILIFGALRAARASITHGLAGIEAPDYVAKRLAEIDEQLRTLSRDIAKECGL